MLKQQSKHIVIIAGESSGDLHAATLVRKLKQQDPTLSFSGMGGPNMQHEGVYLVSDLARFGGVTGIVEVLKHLKPIRIAYRALQAHLREKKPDLLILVDFPGFNLRIANYAKKTLGIKILYYISPQIWAWKAGRIKRIRESVDHMAVIFPFEKKIYQEASVPVSFVGHPLTQHLPINPADLPTRHTLGLPNNKRLLAMLPGSRVNEIERHMPIFSQAAKRLIKIYPDLHIVIVLANTLNREHLLKFWQPNNVPYTVIQGKRAPDIARVSDAIVVASGTASLECALLAKPMCIIYKVGLISYLAASVLLRVQYIGLCNLLCHRMIVPELLQYDLNAEELTKILCQLLETPPNQLQSGIKNHLTHLKHQLSNDQADCHLEDLVLKLITE